MKRDEVHWILRPVLRICSTCAFIERSPIKRAATGTMYRTCTCGKHKWRTHFYAVCDDYMQRKQELVKLSNAQGE